MNCIVEFFKEIVFYDETYFRKIEENTKVYNKPYDEIKEFVGCYPIYNERNEIIDFKLILPKLDSIDSELIYVHEYTHALFLEDESEIFPSIMEAFYINKYARDKRKILLSLIEEQLKKTEDENHIIVLKIKKKIIKDGVSWIEKKK